MALTSAEEVIGMLLDQCNIQPYTNTNTFYKNTKNPQIYIIEKCIKTLDHYKYECILFFAYML